MQEIKKADIIIIYVTIQTQHGIIHNINNFKNRNK